MSHNVQNMLQSFEDLLKRLQKTEQELTDLGGYEHLPFELIKVEEFEGASLLRQNIADLVASLTHECASQIGFSRFRLQRLLAFSQFRKNHLDFNQKDLKTIIASDGSAQFVLAFLRNNPDSNDPSNAQTFLKRVKDIKDEWAESFGSLKYEEVASA